MHEDSTVNHWFIRTNIVVCESGVITEACIAWESLPKDGKKSYRMIQLFNIQFLLDDAGIYEGS